MKYTHKWILLWHHVPTIKFLTNKKLQYMVTTEEERALLKVSERKGYSAFFKLVALATIK